jgi:uncharacterized repeat protein (TIGR01451 family)
VLLVVVSFAPAAPIPTQAQTNTWYVATTGNDANACNTPAAPCATIQAAVDKAGSGDTIRVAVGTYIGEGSNVVIVTGNVHIAGGWDALFITQIGYSTIEGEKARRGIWIKPGASLRLSNFVIQNGRTAFTLQGGGILNEGNLVVEHSIVRQNVADAGGGIMNNGGRLTVNSSTISRNTSNINGGGVGNSFTGIVIINNSTISNNTMGNGSGGGGGGIGSYSNSSIEVNNSSLIGNGITGGFGGSAINGNANLRNSIIAGNTSTSYMGNIECAGRIVSQGYSLIANTQTCPYTWHFTDIADVDPKLGPLKDHGLGLEFHAPLLGSPVINAGDPNGCYGSAGLLATDQRGLARIGRCDIGPIETSVTLAKGVTGVFQPGKTVTYTLILDGSDAGVSFPGVALTDVLPSTLSYVPGSLQVSSGQASVVDRTLTWSGTVNSAAPTTVNFRAAIALDAWGSVITNTAIATWSGSSILGEAVFTAGMTRVYLPVIRRGD